jgi:hypothetical protein
MTPAPLAVAETDRIAALLAEVMPQAGTGRISATPPDAVTRSVRALRTELRPPASAPATEADVAAVGRLPVRELLGQANWRNESADTVAHEPATRYSTPDPGPLPAPVGVLSVSTLFGLVNWRNRPDDIRPLPVIKPPPPPGAEFTVEAMLPMFGWE